MTPETNLKILELASAIPSMRPKALGPAIKTVAKYKGINGYSISLAASLTKLIKPINQTVRGKDCRVLNIAVQCSIKLNITLTAIMT
jgi:hypothetical protein